MDLPAIAIRAAVVFAFLQLMVRLQGKHTIKQGTPFDFVLALIVGDLVDDVILGDVRAGMFFVAATTIFVLRMVTAIMESRVGERGSPSS